MLNDGYNSEVLEIDTEHFVVLRVTQHRLPEALPLSEVRENIVATLRNEKALAAIKARARAMLRQLRGGATIEKLAQENGYEWQVELATTRDNAAVPRALLDRAFQLPPPGEGESTFEYVQNPEGDIEVFELVRVIPGTADALDPAQRRTLERQLVNEEGQRIDEYYQQSLAGRAKIVRS